MYFLTDNLNDFFAENSEPVIFITENVTIKKRILNLWKSMLNVWTLNKSVFFSTGVTFSDENNIQYASIQLPLMIMKVQS